MDSATDAQKVNVLIGGSSLMAQLKSVISATLGKPEAEQKTSLEALKANLFKGYALSTLNKASGTIQEYVEAILGALLADLNKQVQKLEETRASLKKIIPDLADAQALVTFEKMSELVKGVVNQDVTEELKTDMSIWMSLFQKRHDLKYDADLVSLSLVKSIANKVSPSEINTLALDFIQLGLSQTIFDYEMQFHEKKEDPMNSMQIILRILKSTFPQYLFENNQFMKQYRHSATKDTLALAQQNVIALTDAAFKVLYALKKPDFKPKAAGAKGAAAGAGNAKKDKKAQKAEAAATSSQQAASSGPQSLDQFLSHSPSLKNEEGSKFLYYKLYHPKSVNEGLF